MRARAFLRVIIRLRSLRTTNLRKKKNKMFTTRRAPTKTDQDTSRTGKSANNTQWAVVLDGHGDGGRQVAHAVADEAQTMLNRDALDAEGLQRAALRAVHSEKGAKGGTTFTCATVSLTDDRVDVEFKWAGDSTGLIVTPSGFTRTTDHIPTNRLEHLRVLNCGGAMVYHALKSPCPIPIFDAENELIDYGAHPAAQAMKALWAAQEGCEQEPSEAASHALQLAKKNYEAFKHVVVPFQFLHLRNAAGEHGCYFSTPAGSTAVTRSFGDFYMRPFGLTHELESLKISVVGERGCVFLASDGVHDCFKVDELAEVVLTTECDDELHSIFVQKRKALFGKEGDDMEWARLKF